MINKSPPQKSITAEYIKTQLDKTRLSQSRISEEMGFKTPNLLTMIKQGSIKIPIYKIPKLAEILKINPAKLLSMALKEYNPKTYTAIKSVFGYPITETETKILAKLQENNSYNAIDTLEELQDYLDKLEARLK